MIGYSKVHNRGPFFDLARRLRLNDYSGNHADAFSHLKLIVVIKNH
jgi:hypothetical protein